MQSPILIAAFIFISLPVQAQEMLSSWKVRELVVNNQAKHYHRDTDTFEKQKAIAELNDCLTTDSFTLSDYDKVRIITAMARINATQAGCEQDDGLAALYMKKALEIADGRISADALWCALNISNIKKNYDRRTSGEISLYLFRELLRKTPESRLREIMLQPVGTRKEVEDLVKYEIGNFKCSTDVNLANIKSIAKNHFHTEVDDFADAYWFLLSIRGDIQTRKLGKDQE